MKQIWTIASRDFRSYFHSPVAYVVMAMFLLIMGIMFFFTLDYFYQNSIQYNALGKSMNLSEGVIRPLYGNMNLIFLFVVPAITMRLFAEEKKNQTLQLLMTSPVTLTEIVIGKFLAALLFVLVIHAATLVYPITLLFAGNPDARVILTCNLGTFLLTASVVAIGILYSSLTENQIIATVLTFVTGLFFWLIGWAGTGGGISGDFFSYLSLINHYQDFSQGIINTADVVYYLSFIFVGLFLTHRILDSYRWRSS